jgi:hypothetical protein
MCENNSFVLLLTVIHIACKGAAYEKPPTWNH